MKQRSPTSLIFDCLRALWLGALLAACGGGGSSTPSPAPSTGGGAAVQPSVTLSASSASVVAGNPVTLTWSAKDLGGAVCTASGSWSGALAASGSQQVTPSANSTFVITCGTASASTAVAVTTPANVVPMTVDIGPPGANAFDIPFVTVTVCRPGTTVCQTIDHVMVDTGSYGLRLVAPLDGALALPAVTAASGAAVGECGQFVSGYAWGAVVQADVKVGGEFAANQSVQVIGQAPGGVGTAPSECSAIGANIGSVAGLGAKGVLGVGVFRYDCGNACVNAAPAATYYACANGRCTSSALALDKQVANPVASFATDNNGVVLSLPAVGTGGAAALNGTLTFGIGTQSNNALGNATKFKADADGNFVTIYKGTRMPASFIDSGSNGLFFDDPSLPVCKISKGYYCPASPLSLTATIQSADGSTSAAVPFVIENVDALGADITAAWAGGSNGGGSGSRSGFDWGLPFFFGRRVFVGIEGMGTAPYWAY